MNNFSRRLAAASLASALYIPAVSLSADPDGTAIIRVETDAPGPAATFQFKGVVSGSVAAGQSISQSGVQPGAYTAWETGGVPAYELVDITCDDDNSAGYTNTRTARFIIESGESVACVFLYRHREIIDEQPPAPADDPEPQSPQPEDSPAPEPDPPPIPGEGPTPSEEACNRPDMVPREGVWMVSNLPGSMICGPMTLPLAPSQEPGTLTVMDCGWTVVGSGFSEDTADLVMKATDQSGRQYRGTVGGSQDGIPMTIHFDWNLQSDAYITGSLFSEVTQQGMTCRMVRDYEMRFTGNN